MKNAKNRILAAAEAIILEKGASDATIAKIATKAGVADSLVYKHFADKADLLFSVAHERMKEVLEQLTEHLEGIADPRSRLGKMIWFSLKYNDQHKGYARIFLFDCRAEKAFYASPAYQLIRDYSRIMLTILKDGVTDRIFRDDIDMGIVRDIILGILDFEAIRCLTDQDCERCVNDLDDIMAMILPMILAREFGEIRDRSERILAAAEKVIAAKGFSGAQISEIAKAAGVADGTIYEYFQNKEALLLAIPEKYLARHLKELSETFAVTGPVGKLRRIIRQHFTLHLVNRRFLEVFLLSIQLNMRFYHSVAYENYRQYLKLIEEVIKEGKTTGDFRADVNPRLFRDMLLGALSNMALRWLIVEKNRERDKMEEIEAVVGLLSSAVLAGPVRAD